MRLNKIVLKDFLCFHGENILDLNGGSAIFIGRNGHGKSKLFEAFKFVFDNKTFIRGTEIGRNDITNSAVYVDTENRGFNIINHYTGFNSEIKNLLTTSVSLFYEDDDFSYEISRAYSDKKMNNGLYRDPKTWQNLGVTVLKFSKINKSSGEIIKSEEGRYAEAAINKLFPKNIRRYFMFQGENLKDLYDLNDDKQFSQTLKEIARVDIIDNVKSILEASLRIVEKENNDYKKKNSTGNKKKEKLWKEIENLRNQEEYLEMDIIGINDQRFKKKDQLERTKSDINGDAKLNKLFEEIKSAESDLKKLNENISISEKRKKDFILKEVSFLGVNSKVSSFIEKYRKKVEIGEIPEKISRNFIKQMISENKCLICNTKLDDSNISQVKKYLKTYDLKSDIEKFSTLGSYYEEHWEKHERRKHKELKDIEDLLSQSKKERELIKHQLKSFHEKIPEGVKVDHTIDVEVVVNNLTTLKHEISALDTKIAEKEKLKEITHESLLLKENEFDKLDSKISSKDIRQIKLSKMKSFLEEINKKVGDSKNDIYSNIISEIEILANNNYLEIVEDDLRNSGKLIIKEYENQKYKLINVDSNGYEKNSNEANVTIAQFSLMHAFLSYSSEKLGVTYPLITDAPTSTADGANKDLIIQSIYDKIDNSIILIKPNESNQREFQDGDFYNLLHENSVKNRLGNIYWLNYNTEHAAEDDNLGFTEFIKIK